MFKKVGFLAAMIGSAVCPAAVHATTYTVGNYEISSYVVSASATNGSSCPFPAGTYLSSVYSYPGPTKSGAVARQFLNGPLGAYVLQLKFPVTPAAGATTWSGNVTETLLPGGQPITTAFSTSFTILDTKSYVSKTTYVGPVQGGTCTSTVQEVGVWTAK